MCHVPPFEAGDDETGTLAVAEVSMNWGVNLRRSAVTPQYIGGEFRQMKSNLFPAKRASAAGGRRYEGCGFPDLLSNFL
jgi:hypothetical protein